MRAHYESQAQAIDLTDGLSMEFGAWRFNLRGSNTEPLVRLNVEARASLTLMREKTAEVLKLVDGEAGMHPATTGGQSAIRAVVNKESRAMLDWIKVFNDLNHGGSSAGSVELRHER